MASGVIGEINQTTHTPSACHVTLMSGGGGGGGGFRQVSASAPAAGAISLPSPANVKLSPAFSRHS